MKSWSQTCIAPTPLSCVAKRRVASKHNVTVLQQKETRKAHTTVREPSKLQRPPRDQPCKCTTHTSRYKRKIKRNKPSNRTQKNGTERAGTNNINRTIHPTGASGVERWESICKSRAVSKAPLPNQRRLERPNARHHTRAILVEIHH